MTTEEHSSKTNDRIKTELQKDFEANVCEHKQEEREDADYQYRKNKITRQIDEPLPTLEECHYKLYSMEQTKQRLAMIQDQLNNFYTSQKESMYQPTQEYGTLPDSIMNRLYWESGSDEDKCHILYRYYQERKNYYLDALKINELLQERRKVYRQFENEFHQSIPPCYYQTTQTLEEIRKLSDKKQQQQDMFASVTKEVMDKRKKEEEENEKKDKEQK